MQKKAQKKLGSNGRPMTSKLQEATIMFIVDGLNSADLNAAKEAFTLIDTDRDGKLTREEMLQNQVLEFTPEFVDEIFKARDINNDGHITLNEWIVSFVDENNLLSEERVKNAFRQLDKSGDRTVS